MACLEFTGLGGQYSDVLTTPTKQSPGENLPTAYGSLEWTKGHWRGVGA